MTRAVTYATAAVATFTALLMLDRIIAGLVAASMGVTP